VCELRAGPTRRVLGDRGDGRAPADRARLHAWRPQGRYQQAGL
ncbi:MAG: hypothetical protein AVDCRST_MAG55-2725, partial [uncultured Rubrobacteraceae bacterium]